MIEKILVPVDGSSLAEDALSLATSLASRAGAALRLLHVRHPLHPIYIEGLPVIDDALRPMHELHERTYLEQLEEKVRASTLVSIDSDVVEGPVARTIARYAAKNDCKLIAMTTHGYGGLERVWLGSVADRLVRLSSVPLLLRTPRVGLSTGAEGFVCKKILVPLDGSALAEGILDHAVWMAQTMGASLLLFHVVPPGGAQAPLGDEGSAMRVGIAQASEYLHAVAGELYSSELEVEIYQQPHREPASAILAHATLEEVDLIAMTTHGRGGMQRLILGSVSDKVLRGAHVPLLLYRPNRAT